MIPKNYSKRVVTWVSKLWCIEETTVKFTQDTWRQAPCETRKLKRWARKQTSSWHCTNWCLFTSAQEPCECRLEHSFDMFWFYAIDTCLSVGMCKNAAWTWLNGFKTLQWTIWNVFFSMETIQAVCWSLPFKANKSLCSIFGTMKDQENVHLTTICAWSDQKQMVNQQATLSSPDIYYIYILFLWLQHNSCLVVVVLFVVVAVMSCLKWKILLAVFLDIFGTNWLQDQL